jgi:hypothetical protein
VASHREIVLEELEEWAQREDNGTMNYVSEFALTLGFNVKITVVGENKREDYLFAHSPGFKWIRLELRNEHYYLVASSENSMSPIDSRGMLRSSLEMCSDSSSFIPATLLPNSNYGYFSLYDEKVTFVMGEVLTVFSNDDVRALKERRDKSKYQDTIVKVSKKSSLFPTETGWILLGLICCFLDYRVSLFLLACLYVKSSKYDLAVSSTRLAECCTRMHQIAGAGGDVRLAISNLFTSYEINTPMVYGAHNVLADTQEVAEFMSIRIEKRDFERAPLTVVNRPNDDMYVNKLDVIALNQVNGMKGFKTNHFIKFKIPNEEKIKRNVPVAVAPAGPPMSVGGVAGPGLISVTDGAGVISAFAVRGMTKERTESIEKKRFLIEAPEYFWPFINSSICPGDEPDIYDAYRKVSKGKKSAVQVERDLDMYALWLEGGANPSMVGKLSKHSCFNKFESNTKDTGERVEMKARLIMVMSLIMAIELSPMIDVIHAYNQGDFRRFQVKDCSPEEMIEKVERATSVPHVVTDYSSYESSIDEEYRQIEIMILLRLCNKFKWHTLHQNIRKHLERGRSLCTKGVEMWILSRCSGDYCTSFGNGNLSYAIMKYCGLKNGYDLEHECALFEGDDGIVPQYIPDLETIKRLGFQFSVAIRGNKPGDCDFLSSRFMAGRRYLNIAKYIRTFLWVKTGGKELKLSKLMYIWRCMGASLYYLSPGHPVLTALVNFIGQVTAGAHKFKGYEKFIDKYKFQNYNSEYPREVVVDESMRAIVEMGSQDFIPISYADQLLLEENISKGNFHFGDVFAKDASFMECVSAYADCNSDRTNFLKLLSTLKTKVSIANRRPKRAKTNG